MAKKLKIIIPVALVIAAVVLLFNLLLGSAYKKPIKKLFQAMNDEDADIFYEDVVPEFMAKRAKSNSDTYKKDWEKRIKNNKKSLKETLGDDITYSYKIIEAIKMDDEELESQQKSIKTLYEKKVTVKKGYSVAVKVTVKGDDEEKETFEIYRVLKLEDDGWCIISPSTSY